MPQLLLAWAVAWLVIWSNAHPPGVGWRLTVTRGGFAAAGYGVFEKTKLLTEVFAKRSTGRFGHYGNMGILFMLKSDEDLRLFLLESFDLCSGEWKVKELY